MQSQRDRLLTAPAPGLEWPVDDPSGRSSSVGTEEAVSLLLCKKSLLPNRQATLVILPGSLFEALS